MPASRTTAATRQQAERSSHRDSASIWDPAGDNKQTIRAGGGLYFDSPKLWETAHHMLNPPFGNTVNALVPAHVAHPVNVPVTSERLPARLREIPGTRRRAAIRRRAFGHQGEPVDLPRKDACSR